jgi:hypothetical protein
VVKEDVFEDFFGWLVAVVRDLREGFVGRGEDGVVGFGAVQDFNKVIIFVDERGKLGGVFTLVDELGLLGQSKHNAGNMLTSYTVRLGLSS